MLADGVAESLADQIIPLPTGYSFVACQVTNVPFGTYVSDPNVLVVPPYLSDTLLHTNLGLYVWHCTTFSIHLYLSTADAIALGHTAGGFYPDFLSTGPLNLLWKPGRGLIFRNLQPPTSMVLRGVPPVPNFPVELPCGCGQLNLLGCQTNGIGTYENVIGLPPTEGAQVMRFVGGTTISYVTYMFHDGTWESPPGVPMLNPGEAAWFIVPCQTNCITFSCNNNKTVACGSNWSFDDPTNIVDNCCSNYTLTVTTATNTGPCPLVETRTWLVTDICSNTASCSQIVTVIDSTPPVINCSPDKTVPAGTIWSFDPPTAYDTCCGSNLTVSPVNNYTNVSSSPCQVAYSQVWQAISCCGVTATCTQTVTVVPGACQVFNTGMSGPDGNVPIPVGGPDPNYILLSTPTGPGTAVVEGVIPPMWLPNTPESQWIGPAVDTTFSPFGTYHYQLQFLVCCPSTNSQLSGRIAADDAVTVFLNGSLVAFTPMPSYSIWTPINVTSGFVPGLNVLDIIVTNGILQYTGLRAELTNCNSGLTVSCFPDKIIPCGTNWSFDPPFASSCCTSNIYITALTPVTNGLCPQHVTETWLIADACGNSNTCSQTVTVSGPPPSFFGIAIKTNLCNLPLVWNTPVAVDPCCLTNVTVTVVSTTSMGIDPVIWKRTWAATNCCGSSSMFTETIVQEVGPPPPNDDCDNAIPVFADSSTCGTTLCATPSLPGTLFPTPCGNSMTAPDVWYKFTSQCGGTVTFSTCGTNCAGTPDFNTVLSVYTGICGQLIQAGGASGCNDNYCGFQSQVVLSNVQACSTYYIRVAGFVPKGGVPQTGNFVLNVSEVIAPPANDLCANATPVGNGTYPFQNCGANTDGPTVPTNCPSFNDVWFVYTPPCDGLVWVETCNSCFPTVLSVYSGSCVNLNLLGCNQTATAGRCSGSLNSFVSFNAIRGLPYYIRVGSAVDGVTGGGFLTVNGPYPPLGTCPPASGLSVCRLFAVVGPANNTPWSWSIQAPCCANIEVTNVPGVPTGSSAVVLAAAFVNSINGAGCPGLRASTVGLPSLANWFSVCMNVCPGSGSSFVFRVGPAGAPEEDQCVVTGPVLPTAGPCSFNPVIFELPTSGQDLNTNGVDDAIDILAGTSLDLDQNNIPDDAQACLSPVLTDVPNPQTTQAGATIVLSAQSDGTSPVTYRWNFAGIPLIDGGNISGSHSSALTIQSITAANLGDYNVTASNACGVAASPPATLSFQIITAPTIVSPAIVKGIFQFRFQTQTGVRYVIEYKEDLSSPAWTPLETVDGDGELRQAADILSGAATRFYRVRSLSP